MNMVLSCYTNCKDLLLSSSEKEIITITICCTIVIIILTAAISILLYHTIKRICDGLRQKRQTKRDYQDKALDYI